MYRRKLLKRNIQSLVEFSQVSRGSVDDVNGLGICVAADLSELYVTVEFLKQCQSLLWLVFGRPG
jgi:hypothetical protein